MRIPLFVGLLLSAVYKKASAFSPSECLEQLTQLEEEKTFIGRENVYCSYIKSSSIEEATFDVKNSKLEDWDITIGQWNKRSLSIDTAHKPSITKENDYYKLATNDVDINAIVWVSNANNAGEIADVQLKKNFNKRDEPIEYEAFKGSVFIWKDISWDNTNEKIIANNLININNTSYLDTLALQFKKENNPISANNFFNKKFSIDFKIRSDSSDWIVYTGQYNENTNEVKICHQWPLKKINSSISVTPDAEIFLTVENSYPNPKKSKTSSCHNNIIWWQNDKNDPNFSQRIWISNLKVKQYK